MSLHNVEIGERDSVENDPTLLLTVMEAREKLEEAATAQERQALYGLNEGTQPLVLFIARENKEDCTESK